MKRVYQAPDESEQLHISDKAVAHIKQVGDKFRLRTSLNQERKVTEQHYFTFSMALVEAIDFMLAAERDEGLLKITQDSRLTA